MFRMPKHPLASQSCAASDLRGDFRADGFGISAKARAYLKPLIQGEAYPAYREGLPGYRRFTLPLARRRLPAWRHG
jgi:hypothetical protein